MFGSVSAQTDLQLAMCFWSEIAPLELALADRGRVGAHSEKEDEEEAEEEEEKDERKHHRPSPGRWGTRQTKMFKNKEGKKA